MRCVKIKFEPILERMARLILISNDSTADGISRNTLDVRIKPGVVLGDLNVITSEKK